MALGRLTEEIWWGRSCCSSSSQEATQMKFAYRKFAGQYSGEQHLAGSEGSKIVQKSLLGCHVVPTRNSANPRKEL